MGGWPSWVCCGLHRGACLSCCTCAHLTLLCVQVEGIALDEESLTYLGEIGEETSLRHAVQVGGGGRAGLGWAHMSVSACNAVLCWSCRHLQPALRPPSTQPPIPPLPLPLHTALTDCFS